jgi:hypothetical protein
MPRPVKGVAPADGLKRKDSKSRIVPLNSSSGMNAADAAGGGEHKKGSSGPSTRKPVTVWKAANDGDPETGKFPKEEEEEEEGSGDVDELSVGEGCVDCMAAYGFTCASIENFCRCICPHGRHVPRVIYLVVVAIILVGFLVVLFVGVSCQVRPRVLWVSLWRVFDRSFCAQLVVTSLCWSVVRL